jgi:accessory colonization factor AcfC
VRRIVIVLPSGPSEHPRSVVGDSAGRFWSGHSWEEDHSKARLFYSGNEAASVALQLQREEFQDAQVFAFYTVPIKLLVRSSSPVEQEQVLEWARRAIETQVHVGHGVGPRSDVLVEVMTDWNEFRPRFEKVDDEKPP